MLGPPGVTPPWRSCPDRQEGNSGECLRGCGLYGREPTASSPLCLQEPGTLWVKRVTLRLGPGLGWPLLPLLHGPIREHLLCAVPRPGPPQPRGCLHFCMGACRTLRCMAPSPHPASGSRALFTADRLGRQGALPSRPVWDSEGAAPGNPSSGYGHPVTAPPVRPVVSGETYSVGCVEKEGRPASRVGPGQHWAGVRQGPCRGRDGPGRGPDISGVWSPHRTGALLVSPPAPSLTGPSSGPHTSGPKQTPLESTQLPGANVSV